MTKGEAAEALAVGVSTIQRLISLGHLDSVRIGKARRIRVESVNRIAEHGVPAVYGASHT